MTWLDVQDVGNLLYDYTRLQPFEHPLLAPGNHPKPIFENPDSREKFECNMNKPRDWAQWSKEGEGPLHQNNNVMPLLTRQHVKCPAENELAHAIKAKPVEQIRSFSDFFGSNVFIDTTLKLINEWNDAFLVLVKGCVSQLCCLHGGSRFCNTCLGRRSLCSIVDDEYHVPPCSEQ